MRKPDKRKLKPVVNRKPKDVVTTEMLSEELSEITGFRKQDIHLVLKEFGKLALKKVLDVKSVKISSIGTLFPLVRIGCYSPLLEYKFGPEGAVGRNKFIPKFQITQSLKRDLDSMEVPYELAEQQFLKK
jgi:hypothetical protein